MEKTKSLVDSSDDRANKKTPSKRSKPSIPPEFSGIQYNFCKNLECSQFRLIPSNEPKDGKKPYIFVSGGKNYPLLKCNVCSESPPLKSNKGIVSEIDRISAYLKPKDSYYCKNEKCKNHSIPIIDKEAYISFGKTKAGAPRYRCKRCRKTFSIPRRTQYQHKTHDNKMIFILLTNKMPLSRIIDTLEISWEVLYNRIDFIHKQCLAFAGHRERKLKNLPIERLYLSVDRQSYTINWTERKDKRNVILSAIATADNKTGYVFGIHPNFDPSIDREEIETDAKKCGDNKTPPPHRKYAQYWLESDYHASLRKKKNGRQIGNNITEDINLTYQEALGREDDVEVFDEKTREQKLPDYGMQVHAEYTLIAHFYFLKNLLGNVEKWRFFLDQESGIRAALISAFHEEIVNHEAEAFYIKINKGLTVDQKRLCVKDAKFLLDELSSKHPDLSAEEIKLILLKERISESKELGQWKDRWVEHPLPSMSEPERAMCWLTTHAEFDEDHVAWLYNKASLHGIDSFFQKIRRRNSMLERSIHSASNDGRTWNGYAPYNPNNAIKLVEIFRVVHNFIDVPTKKIKGKQETTPAMRLGLAKARIQHKDILYFK